MIVSLETNSDFEGVLPLQKMLSFCKAIKTGMVSCPTVKMIASLCCRHHSENGLEVTFRNSGATTGGARCMNDDICIARKPKDPYQHQGRQLL